MLKFVTEMKFTPQQMYRGSVAIGGTLVLIWGFSGDFIKARAAEAFTEMLIQQGMNPKDFAGIQKKTLEIDKKTDELASDNDKIRGDINAVKQQVGKVSDQIEEQGKTVEKVEGLVQRLLELQLRRSSVDPQ